MAYILIKIRLQDCILRTGEHKRGNHLLIDDFDGLGAFLSHRGRTGKGIAPLTRDGTVWCHPAEEAPTWGTVIDQQWGAELLFWQKCMGLQFLSWNPYSVPNVDGPQTALWMAINIAGIPLEEISPYINAHCLPPPLEENLRQRQKRKVFWKPSAMSSTKSKPDMRDVDGRRQCDHLFILMMNMADLSL